MAPLNRYFFPFFILKWFIICFGFKKTNKEISTTGGEIIEFYLNKIYLSTDEVFDGNLVCKINF